MNERIKELAVLANLLPNEIGPKAQTRHMKKKEEDLEKFAQLVISDIVKTMVVCNEDFYYDENTKLGSVKPTFYIEGAACKTMGTELTAEYYDSTFNEYEIRGTGWYNLNENFVKYLFDLAFNDEK